MRLLALTVLVACGAAQKPEPYAMPAKVTHDGTRPAPTPTPSPSGPEKEYADLAVTIASKMTAIAKALSPDKRECSIVAAELAALAPTFTGTSAAVARITGAGRTRILNYALEPHASTMTTAARVIVGSPTLSACNSDPTFLAALDTAWAL